MNQSSGEQRIADAFVGFCKTIAALRHPETGCPWDLQQDHKSLRRYLIEEAYEAVEAMGDGCPKKICDELGDVLLQVVLNSQLAQDAKQFNVADVIDHIHDKMIRRHPHVFGSDEQRQDKSAETIKANWQKIKEAEQTAGESENDPGVFHEAKGGLPALLQAYEIGKISKRIHFDWQDPESVLAKVEEEVAELREAFTERNQSPENVRQEIGDVFFSLVQLCRHLGFDAETTALDGNRKFLARFAKVEQVATERGLRVNEISAEQLEELWREAKTSE